MAEHYDCPEVRNLRARLEASERDLREAKAEAARLGGRLDQIITDAVLEAHGEPPQDTQRMDWLERHTIAVRDGAGKLVFARAPGASLLREYIDDCRQTKAATC